MILKKALCFLMVAGILSVTACGNEKKGSVNFEYGKTMMVQSEGLPFPVEFDSKFISAEEAAAVADYYYAIEKQDEELSKESSYPSYLDFLTKTYEFDSIKSFLKSNYDTIGNVLQVSDYSFKNIKITSCFDESNQDVYTGFSDIDEILEQASEGISSKIQKRKFIEADIICSSGNEDISLTEKAGKQQLYIYTIDGKPYVL